MLRTAASSLVNNFSLKYLEPERCFLKERKQQLSHLFWWDESMGYLKLRKHWLTWYLICIDRVLFNYVPYPCWWGESEGYLKIIKSYDAFIWSAFDSKLSRENQKELAIGATGGSLEAVAWPRAACSTPLFQIQPPGLDCLLEFLDVLLDTHVYTNSSFLIWTVCRIFLLFC